MDFMVIRTVDILGDIEILVLPVMDWKTLDSLPKDVPEFGANGFMPEDFTNPKIYQEVSVKMVYRY